MKRRRVILILIALMAAVVVAVLVWPGEKEPEYQGKKLSEWAMLYEQSFWPNNTDDEEPPPETPARREALNAARAVRDQLLPRALKMISYRKPKWKESVGHFMEVKLNVRSWCPLWIWRPFYGDRGEDNMVYFQMLGSNAAPAVPELTRILHESESERVRERATTALAWIGKEGLPPLMQVLRDSNNPEWRYAAFAIGALKSEAAPAVPVLVGYLKDPDIDKSWAAAYVLGLLELEADSVVPALTNFLGSTNEIMCETAIEAIGKFGVRARSAVPVLVPLLNDENMRWGVTNALREIAPEVLPPGARVRPPEPRHVD